VTEKCCGKVDSVLTVVGEKEAVEIEDEKHAISAEKIDWSISDCAKPMPFNLDLILGGGACSNSKLRIK